MKDKLLLAALVSVVCYVIILAVLCSGNDNAGQAELADRSHEHYYFYAGRSYSIPGGVGWQSGIISDGPGDKPARTTEDFVPAPSARDLIAIMHERDVRAMKDIPYYLFFQYERRESGKCYPEGFTRKPNTNCLMIWRKDNVKALLAYFPKDGDKK